MEKTPIIAIISTLRKLRGAGIDDGFFDLVIEVLRVKNKLLFDSMMYQAIVKWVMQHIEKIIAHRGLSVLLELLEPLCQLVEQLIIELAKEDTEDTELINCQKQIAEYIKEHSGDSNVSVI